MSIRAYKIIIIACLAVTLASLGLTAFMYFTWYGRYVGNGDTTTADDNAPLAAAVQVSLQDFDEEASAPDTTAYDQPAGPTLPPPPVVIGEKGAQRLQRVVFNPSIGDVHRLHYDRSWGVLLMAVVEPSGLRSIWRLDKDLKLTRVLSENGRPGEIFLEADSLGRVYAGFADPGTLYRSADLGQTWDLVADEIDGAFWTLADDGQGTVWGSLHAYNKAVLYRSTDDGLTWEAWQDFHEVFPEYATTYAEGDDRRSLRHLHAVDYRNGKLFVGVGDVTRFTVMSEDGGETWKQVWSEGFTASVPLADGSGLLLGPDRLQAHGVALYDFALGQTKEVWSPIPYDYAGYTYSLMQMDDIYYAAFHTETNEVDDFSGHSGIIVSPDGQTWYPFFTIEKLTNDARTDMFLATGEWYSYGHVSINGALYRFEPPLGRWFDVHTPFGEE